MKKTVLIIGANSDIAKEISNVFLEKNYFLHLMTRNDGDLILQNKNDLFKEKFKIYKFDPKDHNEFDKKIIEMKPLPEICIIANGFMGTSNLNDNFFDNFEKIVKINFIDPAILSKKIINFYLSNNINGNISIISSVAGIRGRAKNYIYGASKSAIITFFSGLRQKYLRENITFTSIILGFVNTKMTKNEKISKYLNSNPKKVATKIVNAIEKKKEIYFPTKWRIIMFIINLIPEKIFKKLKF